MRNLQYKTGAVAALAVVVAIAPSACSKDTANSSPSMASTTIAAMPTTKPPAAGPTDPAANLVGPGCAAYAQRVPSGPGSVAGMAQDPVAVAASNNPLLTTLTAAVSGKLNPNVNLVDTLNGGEFTVFAPTDDAFKKLPQSTIDTLKTDSER